MTKYTPGPWDVQNKGVLGERSARHEVVQGINFDGSKKLPTIVRMPDLSDRSYANARLIAAAPDLLQLCEQALRLFGGHSGAPKDPKTDIEIEQGYNVLDSLREVIAKAKGTG